MFCVLLDSHPLSLVSNPKASQKNDQCKLWARDLIKNNIPVIIPEIIDYELRRELIRSSKLPGIERLDSLSKEQGYLYLPITTTAIQKAAALWAQARNQNKPTANNLSLDIDVLLAAQAITFGTETGLYTVVATSNVKHISQYTVAKEWDNW